MTKLQPLAPGHWSTDFVEHLRTVHFTLIALCVGLIILSWFPSKSEIQVARDQASEILEVTNTWKEDFLQVAAASLVKAIFPDDKRRKFLVLTDAAQFADFDLNLNFKDKLVHPQFKPPSWIIEKEMPSELLPDTSSSAGPELRIRTPSNLKSFQRLWNSLVADGHIVVPLFPTECFAGGYVRSTATPGPTDKSRLESLVCTVSSPSSHNAASVPVSIRPTNEQRYRRLAPQNRNKWEYEFSGELTPFPLTERGFGIILAGGEVILPIPDVKRIDLDGQKVLIQRSDKWKDKDGRLFKDAFGELAADAPFEDVDIGSAVRILDEEAKRTADSFEAVGLKIPAAMASKFGVFFVLVVQFYLWMHLHEFRNRTDRDAGFDVAWVGVYSRKPAQFAKLLSLFGLPVFTVLLLGTRWPNVSQYKVVMWALASVAAGLSVFFSWLTIRALPQRSPSEAVKK